MQVMARERDLKILNSCKGSIIFHARSLRHHERIISEAEAILCMLSDAFRGVASISDLKRRVAHRCADARPEARGSMQAALHVGVM